MSTDPRYARYEIGQWSYGTPAIVAEDGASTLTIGKFCSLADGVTIMLGGEHRTDWVTTYPFSALFPGALRFEGHPRSKGDVVIGNDVWIGADALILSGVNVGDGAVIGARSLVTRNVPAYSIVGGDPARVLRFRFSDWEIHALLEIAWWDWPIEKITDAWPLLLSNRIADFIDKYRSVTAI